VLDTLFISFRKEAQMKKDVLGLFFALGCILLFATTTLAVEPIKIGALVPTTGDLAAYGPPVNNGAKLAAKDINAAGGILGRKVEIILRDTQTNPTAAVDAAKKLVDIDNVVAITGALSSGVTIPVATSVSIPSKIVQISPASTSEKITTIKDDDYLFRTVPMDALQAPALAQVMTKDKHYTKVSIVYVNNDYGEGLAKGIKASFEKMGGHVTALIPYNKKQASYRGEAQKAIDGKPQAVVMVAYPQFGAVIVRQILQLGFKGGFVFSDGMEAPEIAKNVGAKYVENDYGTAPGNPNQDIAGWFQKHYQSEYGEMPPKPYIDTEYDAVVLIALAIAEGGSATPAAVHANIRKVAGPPGVKVDARHLKEALKLIKEGKAIDYEGVSGSCNFDKYGDVPGSYKVWKFSNGEIKTVKYITIGM
jgi:ABC-type branched-subunit amino acid transport system substrate-binding protein